MKLGRLVLIIGGLVLLAVLLWVGGELASRARDQDATPTPEGEEASAGIAIRARGEVVPVLWADLSFDTAGPVAEWFVVEGDVVTAGTPLGRLNTTSLERAVAQAELELRQAQVHMAQLQEPADEVDIRQAEHAVDQAAAALEVAQLDLAELLNVALLNETLEDAQKVFEDAKHRYEVRLDQYEQGQTDYYFLDQAKQRYDDARLNLDRIRQQGDLQLEERRNEVERAQQAYQEAQDSLARLLKGIAPLELETAQLEVREAQLALEEARTNLEGATLVAPFDGTVVALHLRLHDWAAGAGAPAVTLADLSTLWIETTDLDEWGAAQIHVGSEATLVFNAFDDKTLTGRVVEIALRGETLPAGDVVYRTIIELDEPDPELRWGMTVRITIPMEE